MNGIASQAISVSRAIDTLMREDRGRLLAALVSRLRNLDLAEEALQEAAISAMQHWGRSGLPSSPKAWLLKVAFRKALDKMRGAKRSQQNAQAFSLVMPDMIEDEPDEIPDERLRLIFTCCHPALDPKSQVALTLRTICGLTTGEIANAFLDTETTMGQRISRAKSKITNAAIPFSVPDAEEWDSRCDTVLTTVYLIFTTGYVAGRNEERDLCAEAIFLARLLDVLRSGNPEIQGALALMLLTDARRNARTGPDGASVPPGEQDRSLWNLEKIAEGRQQLDKAMALRAPGPFQIKAAISDCHMAENGPDWPQIALLYRSLFTREPNPVVELNLAVATAEAGFAKAGLMLCEQLGAELEKYQPFHAARADLLAKNGRAKEALAAYDTAMDMIGEGPERLFLEKRRAMLVSSGLPGE